MYGQVVSREKFREFSLLRTDFENFNFLLTDSFLSFYSTI